MRFTTKKKIYNAKENDVRKCRILFLNLFFPFTISLAHFTPAASFSSAQNIQPASWRKFNKMY